MTPQHPASQTSADKCEVCGCAIDRQNACGQGQQTYPVCQSFACRRILSQKATLPPDVFESQLEIQRRIHRGRHEASTPKKSRIHEAIKNEARQNQAILQAVLEKHAGLSQTDLRLVALPSGREQSVALSDERRRRYIEHINDAIVEASKYTSASDISDDKNLEAHQRLLEIEQRFSNVPELRTLSDRLCGLCKGGCCTSGKEHAYLSALSLRRVMDDNPHLSDREILNRYIAHISPDTIEGSCINQTASGCALPRELRSETCNSFYCEPLKAYQRKTDSRAIANPVLIIQRANVCTTWMWRDPNARNDVVRVVLMNGGAEHDHDLATLIPTPADKA